MFRTKPHAVCSFLLLAASLAVPGRAAATSYVMVSDAALVDQAAVIALVEITGAGAASSPGGPSTDFGADVVRLLKGSVPGHIVVRVPGGTTKDGVSLRIPGAPRFAARERAVLFLSPRPDGTYRILHLMLGAFHVVSAGGSQYAVRDLRDTQRLRMDGHAVSAADAREPMRALEAWSDWVAKRAAGLAGSADYAGSPLSAARELDLEIGAASDVPTFSLFFDGDSGFNIRWFDFDKGRAVKWFANEVGQVGIPGGGYTEFQQALAAWTADDKTPIDYQYGGTTSAATGLIEFDWVNAILFNDPNDEVESFDCELGGVLAYGGPWYTLKTPRFRGQPYHRTVRADIVVNDGLECFFRSTVDASSTAAELFTHELGHTLGLDHSCGDYFDCDRGVWNQAIMRSYIHEDGRGAHLGRSDHDAIARLYQQDVPMPEHPSRLRGTAVSNTQVSLTWVDNAKGETDYLVEVWTTEEFVGLVELPKNSTSVVVGGLDPDTEYLIRVRALRLNAFSPFSNLLVISTLE